MQNVSNPYARYAQAYAPTESDPYAHQANYAYPMNKYSKPEENYSYTSYTPPQYSSQIHDPQSYSNPYYSATRNSSTAVTDSQNSTTDQANVSSNTNQYNVYNNPYMTNQTPATPDPNMAQYTPVSQDFNASFAQMQISTPKNEPVANYGGEYGQTQFSVQYPQSYTPNMATYSSAAQKSNTNIVGSPMPSDGNYPYMNDPTAQYGQASMPNVSNPAQNAQVSVPNVPNPMPQYGQSSAPNQTGQYGQTPAPNVSNPMSQYNITSTPNASNPMAQYAHSMMPNTSNPMAQYDQSSLPNMSNPMAQYGQTSMPNDPAAKTFNSQTSNQMSNFPNTTQNIPSNQTPGFSNQQNIPGSNQLQYSVSNTSVSAAPDLSNQMQYAPNATQNFTNTIQNAHMPGQTQFNPTSGMSNFTPNYPMQAPQNSVPNSSSAIPTVSGYDQQYAFSTSAYENTSQGYVYTNAENTITSTTNTGVAAFSAGQPYSIPNEATGYIDPSLSQLDALDKPIKSHVTGEALSTGIRNQHYNPMSQIPEQSYQATNAQYLDQSNAGYVQNYQNHPGYTYNAASGNYDYNYGSQNSYTNYGQANVEPQSIAKDPNWNSAGVYTSAGPCQTVQSPSDNPQSNNTVPSEQTSNSQIYYNQPYGYQTVTNQANEITTQSMQVTTNYGANVNCSTYIQSGQMQDTSVTFTQGKNS